MLTYLILAEEGGGAETDRDGGEDPSALEFNPPGFSAAALARRRRRTPRVGAGVLL